MGATTSILYLAEGLGVANCVVLDSGFSSLDKVMNSMAQQMGIPNEFVQMLMPMI